MGDSSLNTKSVVIIGAGLAGLATGFRLSQHTGYKLTILEKENHLGGLAATIALGDGFIDLGSHRIHPGYCSEAMEIIRSLMGDELLTHKRKGELFVNEWALPYPATMIGVLRAIGPINSLRIAFSLMGGRMIHAFSPSNKLAHNYEQYLLARVGKVAYKYFHEPYAAKVYGVAPAKLSAMVAIAREGGTAPPGFLNRTLKEYQYPAEGFGAIATRLADFVIGRGANIVSGAHVDDIASKPGGRKTVAYITQGEKKSFDADVVISTMPINELTPLLRPTAPGNVASAARLLRWRGIRLLQIRLNKLNILNGETCYFPDRKFIFGRISEPKRFSPMAAPDKRQTSLNVEVIATPGDELWSMPDDQFCHLVYRDLEKTTGFHQRDVLESRSIYLPNVYPVYAQGFASHLSVINDWLVAIENLHSIGRGGQFFHGNADHSIVLGLDLAESILNADSRPPTHMDGFKVRV